MKCKGDLHEPFFKTARRVGMTYFNMIFLLLFVTTSTTLHAQPEKLRFEHLGTEQGLADNTTISIMKDRQGYLWFATWNGLNRFDGYTFKTYQFDPSDSNSIGGNVIRAIYQDSNDLIWVSATGTDIFTFDPKTEYFKKFHPTLSFPFSTITAIGEDGNGMIWFGSSTGEVGRYDKKKRRFYSGTFAKEMAANNDANYTPQLSIWNLSRDNTGRLWILGTNGLFKVNMLPGSKDSLSQVSFTHYQHDANNRNSLVSNVLRCLCMDHYGILWIGTLNGLSAFNPITGEFKSYQNIPGDSSSLSYDDVRGVVEDKQGNIWVATQVGLNKLDKDRKCFTRYFHDEFDPASLSSDYIYSMTIDNTNIIWLATIGGGISKLDLNQSPVLLYRHHPLDINSISSNRVSAICEDRSGIVWIGTIGGGLNAWNKKTNKFVHYRRDPSNSNTLPTDTISALVEDEQGTLWIGGGSNRTGILARFDRARKTFTHVSFSYGFTNVNKNPVLTLYLDHAGYLWIGTTNGIMKFNRQTQTWSHYPHDPKKPEGLSDFWCNTICEDSKGNLWIGPNSNALNKFDPVTGKVKHYNHIPRDSTSITSSIVKKIIKDSKGTLWFATRHGGLCKFDSEKEVFTSFLKKRWTSQ